MRLRMELTNHSAAEIVSTNQNQAYSPCDFNDVKAPKYGHKNHVTPHKRWSRILGIVWKDRVEPGYEWDTQNKPQSPRIPRKSIKNTHSMENQITALVLMDVPRKP